MKIQRVIFFASIFIACSTQLLFSIRLASQDIDLTANDTVVDPDTFDLSQISRKSAELTLKAQGLARQALAEEELGKLEKENKQIINFIDSLLNRETFVRMNTLSARNLKGKLIYWQLNLQTVNSQENQLSSVFKELNESVNYLEKELVLWANTNELVQGDDLADAVHERFAEVKLMIDTTKNVLDNKSAKILSLLDAVARQEVEIESMISKIELVIKNKQEGILNTDQASLFELDYTNKSKWLIPKSYLKYYSGNFVYLTNYMKNHIGNLIAHIILLVFLILGFIEINKLNIKTGKEEGAKYQKNLIVLLSRPVSSALIIWLFATVVIYPYRPLLFLDSVRFLVTIPIVIVLINILPKKYHNYAYVFGLLVFLHIVLINLPGTHIIARLVLMLLSLLEVATFAHFVIHFRKDSLSNKVTSKYILIIGYALLIVAISGLLANIIGKVALSIFMVEAVLGVILVFILISFSLVVVNGLAVLLIDSKYGDKLNIIKKYKTSSKHKVTRFFNVVAVVLMIYFVLGIFGIQTIIFDWFNEFFSKERNIGSMAFNWGNILVFFLVIYLSIVIANLIRSFLE